MMNRWQKGQEYQEYQDVGFKSSDGSIEAKLSRGANFKLRRIGSTCLRSTMKSSLAYPQPQTSYILLLRRIRNTK